MEENPLLVQLQKEIRSYNNPVYFAENILTEKLWDKQKEILIEFYNPDKNYRELVICAGMRSSKTYLASIICLFEAFKLLLLKDPAEHYGLSKGHKIFIINVATSEQQAKDTVFSQIESILKNSKWFMDFKPQIRHQEIRFPGKNLIIRSEHSNSASLVGKTSKCVKKGTKVITNKGIINIEDIENYDKVLASGGLENITAFLKQGKKPILKLTTKKGYELEATGDHKILTFVQDTNIVGFKQLDQLDNNDFVILGAGGLESFNNKTTTVSGLEIKLNEDLGYVIGFIIGDGTVHSLNVAPGNYPEAFLDKFQRVFGKEEENFNVRGPFFWNENSEGCYQISIKKIPKLVLKKLFGDLMLLSPKRTVPRIIFQSNADCIKGFLKGYYDAEGHVDGKHEIRVDSRSETLIKEVQLLLLLVGIRSARRSYEHRHHGKKFHYLSISGDDIITYGKEIGFHIEYKNKQMEKMLSIKRRCCWKTLPKQETLQISGNYFLDQVKSVTKGSNEECFDISVLPSKTFYANGILVHNCVVFDELSRFKDTQGKNSAEAVYESLSRSVQTFGGEGKVISISSPLYRDELLMRLLKLSKKAPFLLSYHLATWELNPNITRESLEPEFIKNPEAAMRDYGAVPSSALEVYFKQPEKIDECVDILLKPIVFDGKLSSFETGKSNYAYFLGGDPALKNDSFGLALVHREGDMTICDLSYRLTPTKEREISALEVKNLILSMVRQFNVQEAVFDTWHFPETLEEVANQGVKVSQSIVRKLHYDNLKELFYTGKIRIPQNEILIDELKNLELLKGNKVDHPKHGSKDMADALANACFLLRSSEVIQLQPPAWYIITE